MLNEPTPIDNPSHPGGLLDFKTLISSARLFSLVVKKINKKWVGY